MEKGTKATGTVTILKVADNPRTFGDGGKAFSVTCDESGLMEFGGIFELEIYDEKGAEMLRALKGSQVTLDAEFVNEYQGTQKWKIVKFPGWERGQGRGGKGSQWSPEREMRERCAVALQAAVTFYSGFDTAVDAPQITTLAEDFLDWIDSKVKAVKPAPSTPADGAAGSGPAAGVSSGVATEPLDSSLKQGAADPKDIAWNDLKNGLALTMKVLGENGVSKASDFEWIKEVILKPVAEAEGMPFPPTKESLHVTQIRLLEQALAAAARKPEVFQAIAAASQAGLDPEVLGS